MIKHTDLDRSPADHSAEEVEADIVAAAISITKASLVTAADQHVRTAEVVRFAKALADAAQAEADRHAHASELRAAAATAAALKVAEVAAEAATTVARATAKAALEMATLAGDQATFDAETLNALRSLAARAAMGQDST
jgi:hypothetical protein